MHKCIQTTTVRCMSSHGLALYRTLSATLTVYMYSTCAKQVAGPLTAARCPYTWFKHASSLPQYCANCARHVHTDHGLHVSRVLIISTQDQLSKTCCPAIAPACGSP